VDPSTPRLPNRAQPLRMRLLLLAASGLVPLMIVLAWGFNHLVEKRQADAEETVLELSRALANGVDDELRSVMTLLQHMGTSDELERADLRDFHQTAMRTAEQLGWYYAALADADGRVLFRTDEVYGTSSATAREATSVARVIATGQPAVGPVMDLPERASTGFAVRVPVMRGGRVVYVLSAVLPTSKLLSVLDRQALPSGSVTAVFDQSNRRVARTPATNLPGPSASLLALLARGDQHGVGRTVTLEGVESHTGFTRLPGSGWVVAVGTSMAESNAALLALLRAVAAGLAASLALAVVLAWVLARRVVEPIEALKEAASALGRGAPVQLPPLDIVELNDVALALTAAAAERDRAAAQVRDALRTAEDANRSKDQFLAVLGHELRNPLAPIATAVQLMALKGDDRTAHERRIIERQLVHVTRLVDDLLDVSRITSGRLAIRREPVPVGPLLTQVVDAMRQSQYQHSLSLDLGPGVEDAWLHGDEVRLAQVFNNLLVNGIKFTPPGGAIRVKAAVEGDSLRVNVEDTGAGITQPELARIFELFYQAPQNSDRARGGLGLGLAIVKSLVEMHGGTVSAASDGPGKGSCMTVRLPLVEPPAAPRDDRPAAAAAVAVQGAASLLVVDDNEDAADTCATLLAIHGYSVRVAYRPEAALELLRELSPQVAILDIGLPGMSGYTLAGRMRAQGYRGRLVALTGYGQAADMAAAKAAGFDAHLTKPVEPAQLLELVAGFAQRPAEAPAAARAENR